MLNILATFFKTVGTANFISGIVGRLYSQIDCLHHIRCRLALCCHEVLGYESGQNDSSCVQDRGSNVTYRVDLASDIGISGIDTTPCTMVKANMLELRHFMPRKVCLPLVMNSCVTQWKRQVLNWEMNQ